MTCGTVQDPFRGRVGDQEPVPENQAAEVVPEQGLPRRLGAGSPEGRASRVPGVQDDLECLDTFA